jgi:WD repeat-containing protein 23
MARGTCTLHSYNDNVDDEGEPPMGQSVNHLLKEQPELYQNSTYTNGLRLG